MRILAGAIGLLVTAQIAHAGDLCTVNSFTRAQAQQGRVEYESSCGLCHQYNLKGRLPGNFMNETPDIALLDAAGADYVKAVDGNGGVVPPLLGAAFFSKWKDQKAFSDRISNAIGAFPPKSYVKPDSDIRIAAYILFRNCDQP
jgi:hypothetical protein